METQMVLQASKSREKSRGGRPGPPTPDSDWQTVAVSNKGRPQIDPSKLINLGRNRVSKAQQEMTSSSINLSIKMCETKDTLWN